MWISKWQWERINKRLEDLESDTRVRQHNGYGYMGWPIGSCVELILSEMSMKLEMTPPSQIVLKSTKKSK